MYLTYIRTCTCILHTCLNAHFSYLRTYMHMYLTYMPACTFLSYLRTYMHMYLTCMRTCTCLTCMHIILLYMHTYLTCMRTCSCILPTCVHAHVTCLHAYMHTCLTCMRACTRILPTCVHAYLSYFEGMETIELECFDESVVRVRLSVHWTTTISPLRFVATSPFLFVCFGCWRHVFSVAHHRSCQSCSKMK